MFGEGQHTIGFSPHNATFNEQECVRIVWIYVMPSSYLSTELRLNGNKLNSLVPLVAQSEGYSFGAKQTSTVKKPNKWFICHHVLSW